MVLRDPGGVMKLVVGSVLLEVTLSRTDDSRHMQGLSGCVMLNTVTFMWTTCRVEGRWKAYSVCRRSLESLLCHSLVLSSKATTLIRYWSSRC